MNSAAAHTGIEDLSDPVVEAHGKLPWEVLRRVWHHRFPSAATALEHSAGRLCDLGLTLMLLSPGVPHALPGRADLVRIGRTLTRFQVQLQRVATTRLLRVQTHAQPPWGSE